ncbi:hypothetical protein niasHS_002076 [Heterodera schachtii]|uniref:Uncharacterized protein n=2 Tax=Heterodera TaxID=34509 RepID=A0ABD2K5S6_HETSC
MFTWKSASDRRTDGPLGGDMVDTVSAVHYSITTTTSTTHQTCEDADRDQRSETETAVGSLESADGDRVIRTDRKLANAAPAQQRGGRMRAEEKLPAGSHCRLINPLGCLI